MTEAAPHDPAEDLAAAELALGVIEGDARAAALRRLAAEPAFARDVARWRDHFGVLLADVPAVAPPPALAGRVAARIAGGASSVVPLRAAGRWRAAAIAAGALAAGLAAVLLLRPGPAPVIAPAAAPVMVAALQVPGGDQAMLATYDPRHGLRLAGALAIPVSRSAELWVIAGTGGPRPVGVLRAVAADRMELAAPSRQAMPVGATLAISIEPVGGSPTGLPTGPVVASGRLRLV